MGKKYIIIDGKQVEVSDEKLASISPPSQINPHITMGQVVKYVAGGKDEIGKISSATRDGKIVIAKVCNITKAGFQFSSMDTNIVTVDALKEYFNGIGWSKI
jgi:hypothetical protein